MQGNFKESIQKVAHLDERSQYSRQTTITDQSSQNEER